MIALLFPIKLMYAQGNLIEFDAPNGTYDYGTITKTEANKCTLLLKFKNNGDRILYFQNNATAWNDAPSFHHYAYTKDSVLPNQEGEYKVRLRMDYKHILNRYGNIIFTDNKGYSETQYVSIKARIVDSAFSLSSDSLLSISFPKLYYKSIQGQYSNDIHKGSTIKGAKKIVRQSYIDLKLSDISLNFSTDSIVTFVVRNTSNNNLKLVEYPNYYTNSDIRFNNNKECILKPEFKTNLSLKLHPNKFNRASARLQIQVLYDKGILITHNVDFRFTD